jgi:serine/threonine protein kinase
LSALGDKFLKVRAELAQLLELNDCPLDAIPQQIHEVFFPIAEAGAGIYGKVYYVVYLSPEGPVIAAVKVFVTHNAESTMQREAQFSERLKGHVEIMRMILFGKVDKFPFIAFQATNCTLKDLIQEWNKRFPLPFVMYVLDRIMAGLAVIHSHEIIHCDIKPSNIHFCRDLRKIVLMLKVSLSSTYSICHCPLPPFLIS